MIFINTKKKLNIKLEKNKIKENRILSLKILQGLTISIVNVTVYCRHKALHMHFIPSLLLTVTTAGFSALPTCLSACAPSTTSTLNLAATFDEFTAGLGNHS